MNRRWATLTWLIIVLVAWAVAPASAQTKDKPQSKPKPTLTQKVDRPAVVQKAATCQGRLQKCLAASPQCGRAEVLAGILDRLVLERKLRLARAEAAKWRLKAARYRRKIIAVKMKAAEKALQAKEGVSLREIIGGIGWIFGLAGMGLAVAAYRNKSGKA
jgi:hypothetical protein